MVPPAQVHYVCSQTVHKISPAPTTRRSKKTQVYEGVGQSGMSRNAARERFRVKSLRNAFHSLQQCLPSVPRNTKLPKLDVLVLATNYISYLSRILSEDEITQENGFSPSDFELLESTLGSLADTEVKNASWEKSYLHPVKKWPMRSRLYAGVEEESSGITDCSTLSIHQRITWSDCL